MNSINKKKKVYKPKRDIIKKEKNIVIIENGKDLPNYYLRKNKSINKNNLNNMINNWNKFRDKENDLYGDLSLYLNYEEEIQRLVEEEEKIMEEISRRENNDSDSDYHSDNEKF